MKAAIVYPHQLFKHNPALDGVLRVYIVEDPLLFTQFRFHQQKLVLHRASMKYYADRLTELGSDVKYIDCSLLDRTEDLAMILKLDGVTEAAFVSPVDDWLGRRLVDALGEKKIGFNRFDSPMFINSAAEIRDYFVGRKSFSMASFYQGERTKRNILMSGSRPVGGKFSFDTENRKKLPKGIQLPTLVRPPSNEWVTETIGYVERTFSENYGRAADFAYPTTHEEAELWLDQFLAERFELFGDYEDAISNQGDFLFHSVLTPMLNTGLLTPQLVLERTLAFAERHNTPINSLEGFVRQILGWREFMRGVYVAIGRKQRSTNFWNHQRKLPKSFWTGETGIEPLDDVISKVLRTGYSHHIERLMIIGSFMMLAEIEPDEAYRWFMELYIDAYDWVMVPNVYGMSLQADGGSIATKPYISGSNYIRKMSNYGNGEWCEIWDGLYWRFIAKHEEFFLSNHRLSMMPRLLAKMDAGRRERLINTGENFLERFR